MEAAVSRPEKINPSLCSPMKSMLGILRMMMSGRMIPGGLDRDRLGLHPAQPGDDLETRHQDGGEERGQHAEAERYREALDRAGTQLEHQRAGNQRRHMAVENGAEGALEPSLQRRDQRAAAADFLADALIDQHVGVDRHAHGERDAGDAGKRERRSEKRQARHQDAQIEKQRDVGEDSEGAVEHDHEQHDERHADHARQRTVGPDLGADSIHTRALASMVGVALVVLFMVVFYGTFGIFADIALFFNLCILMASLSLLGATLTLPGIAGIALTMGMAVDANVLIYERIREEIRGGRSLISSLQAGFERAFGTI